LGLAIVIHNLERILHLLREGEWVRVSEAFRKSNEKGALLGSQSRGNSRLSEFLRSEDVCYLAAQEKEKKKRRAINVPTV